MLILGSSDVVQGDARSRKAQKRSRSVLRDVVKYLRLLGPEVDSCEGSESCEGSFGDGGDGRHYQVLVGL